MFTSSLRGSLHPAHAISRVVGMTTHASTSANADCLNLRGRQLTSIQVQRSSLALGGLWSPWGLQRPPSRVESGSGSLITQESAPSDLIRSCWSEVCSCKEKSSALSRSEDFCTCRTALEASRPANYVIKQEKLQQPLKSVQLCSVCNYLVCDWGKATVQSILVVIIIFRQRQRNNCINIVKFFSHIEWIRHVELIMLRQALRLSARGYLNSDSKIWLTHEKKPKNYVILVMFWRQGPSFSTSL